MGKPKSQADSRDANPRGLESLDTPVSSNKIWRELWPKRRRKVTARATSNPWCFVEGSFSRAQRKIQHRQGLRACCWKVDADNFGWLPQWRSVLIFFIVPDFKTIFCTAFEKFRYCSKP